MGEIIKKKSFKGKSKSPEIRINGKIRLEELRLIDEKGNQLGILSSKEALKIAYERNLDLVEIAPTAKPPVCKIIDYGKYKYEIAKKEKDSKKKQHVVSVKTIRMRSVNIDTNDLKIKIEKAKEFIEEGNKVKVELMFRGREIVHKEAGQELLKQFYAGIEDLAKFDKPISAEGFRKVVMVLTKK